MFGNEDAMVFSRVPKDRTGPGLADISKPEPQKPNSARAVPSTGSAVAPGATSAAEPETSSLAHSWNPLNHLYVRFDCRPATGAHPEDHREPCRTATPFENPDDTHVWNRTPYWISAIDTNVIRGHNDLWNARFAALLTGMAAQFDVLGPDDVLPEPSARRTSSTY